MSNSDQNAVVSARGLTKNFGSFCAVNQIDFDVFRGECLGILGPNGAGKTTTMRMLLGHVYPSQGELRALDYQLPAQAREFRRRVGVVPQHDNLDPDFTVLENLKIYSSYFGLKPTKLVQRFDELLKFAALEDRAHTAVNTLSGGMKRRLTLARALVNSPEIIVLDEPTTGLDPQARHLIWQRLRALLQSGATLILTTHYLEEAQRLCDRVIIIDRGKILATGKPSELIEQFIEPHVIEIHNTNHHDIKLFAKQLVTERCEVIGDAVFAYSHDENLVKQALQQASGMSVMHRHANLEDVFLKLTGRDLREG